MIVSPIGAAKGGPPSPTDAQGRTAAWLLQLLNQFRDGVVSLWNSGTTAQRPNDPYLGQLFFDTTLGYLIECTAIRAGATPAVWAQLVPPASQTTQVLFDHFADSATSGITVVALYTDTIAANQLANNGDKLKIYYGGSTNATNTGTREWFVSFGGTTILDSTAIATSQNASWEIIVDIIRESSTVVRCIATWLFARSGSATTFTQYTRVTGLTLSNTQALVLSGQASVSGNNITASMGNVLYIVA